MQSVYSNHAVDTKDSWHIMIKTEDSAHSGDSSLVPASFNRKQVSENDIETDNRVTKVLKDQLLSTIAQKCSKPETLGSANKGVLQDHSPLSRPGQQDE